MEAFSHHQYDFAVLGAGALGSIIGAHLSRAGHSVVMLARGRRAAQVQAAGLRITGLSNFQTGVAVLTDPSRLASAKVLVIATKTPGTAEALASLRGAQIDTTFSIQNGMLKDELLSETFGPQHVLGALADTSGEMLADGEVIFTRNVHIYLGELSGEAGPRAGEIAASLDQSGVRAAAVEHILSFEWAKFAGWVGMMALAVTTRAATWSYLSDPGSALVLARLVREMGELARVQGITLTDESILPAATLCADSEREAVDRLLQLGRHYQLTAPRHRMSTLQDLEAGRPLEIHETLAFALRKAAQYGLALPLVDNFYQLISALDRIRASSSAPRPAATQPISG